MKQIELSYDFQAEVSVTSIDLIKPPYVHFKRKSKEYIFYYILAGEMFLQEEGQVYHLEENDYIFLEPDKEHVGVKTSTCQFLYVHFQAKTGKISAMELAEQTEQGERNGPKGTYGIPKYYHLTNLSFRISSRERIQEFVSLFHSNELFCKEMTEHMFQLLLLNLSKEYEQRRYESMISVRGRAKQIIPELITYLNQEYATLLTSNEIQEKFHYHFDYLNRQFKKWTGSTIFHYVNEIRIQHAKQLLSTGLYTIEEVAVKTGFHDVYYFSRVFKQYTRTTPGRYVREK